MAFPPRIAQVVTALIVVASTVLSAQALQRAVYVSVTDPAGNPVEGVGPADFIVREDKVTREVLRVDRVDDPMLIALLVDNSQAADSYVRDYREGLAAFITAITADTPARGKHQIALIGLASRPTIIHDYSSDPAQLLKSAESMFALPGTGTYLLDGIIETSNGISRRESARPVIVAIVTAGQELSDRPFEVVLRSLKASGAALHVIQVGTPTNTTRDRAMVIDQGSRETGGIDENILTSSALPNTLKKVAANLLHQYRVTYARPQTLIPPDAVTVSMAKPGLTARATPARQERR